MFNARFWLWVNGGWVKVTLKPATSLRWGESHATEEGYHFERISLEYDGDTVYFEEYYGGRDCDGELENTIQYACALENLRSDPHEINAFEVIDRPVWKKQSHRVYDQYAQMMNY